jgi:hypothetical protein
VERNWVETPEGNREFPEGLSPKLLREKGKNIMPIRFALLVGWAQTLSLVQSVAPTPPGPNPTPPASGVGAMFDMDWMKGIVNGLGARVPILAAALGILLGGWIAAHVIRSAVYSILKRTTIDDKIAEAFGVQTGGASGDRIEQIVSKTVYYLAILMVFVAFFGYLKIDAVTRPLVTILNEFAGAVPNLLKAIVIGFVGFLVATGVRKLLIALLEKVGFEQRMAKLSGETAPSKPSKKKKKGAEDEEVTSPLTKTLGDIAYWFILIVAAIPVLDALRIGALAAPLSSAFTTITTYLPKVGAATLLIILGYVVSKMVRTLVSGVVKRVGVDRVVSRFGFGKITKTQPLSSILGTAAMAFVLLHFAISAVGRLEIHEISTPLQGMLHQIYTYLPKIMVGGLLMAVGVAVSKVTGNVASRLLAAMGFNTLMVHIGVYKETDIGKEQEESSKVLVEEHRATHESEDSDSEEESDEEDDEEEDDLYAGRGTDGIKTPSDVAGVLVSAVIVMLFLRQVIATMGLDGLAHLLDGLLGFLPHVLVALLVMGAGMWAGAWSHKRVDELTDKSEDRLIRSLGNVAHISIVTFSVMIALHQLGVGDRLIAIAFALVLGAICLALALAFGLGGREVAAKIVQKEYDRRNKPR